MARAFALIGRAASAAAIVAASAGRSRSLTAGASVSTLEVEQFGCLTDNYGYLLHDSATGCTAAIDTPEVAPIAAACARRGWKLTHIFNTHHHADHAGGNVELKQLYGCEIIGPAAEAHKIPSIERPVSGGDLLFVCKKDV